MPCTTYPGQPFIPSYPGGAVETPIIGWNAGATTARYRNGNCYLQFQVNAGMTGGLVGLSRYPRVESASPANLTHAFFIVWLGGLRVVQTSETGVVRGTPQTLAAGTLLRIQRMNNEVTYLIGPSESTLAVYRRSQILLRGPVCGGAVLYTSGDEVI